MVVRKRAIELFDRFEEKYRDWSWYYRKGYAHASLGCGKSYEFEHVQQALQLIETAVKMTKVSPFRERAWLVL